MKPFSTIGAICLWFGRYKRGPYGWFTGEEVTHPSLPGTPGQEGTGRLTKTAGSFFRRSRSPRSGARGRIRGGLLPPLAPLPSDADDPSPCAAYLRRMSREIGERSGGPRWYEMSRRIEAVMKTETQIDTHVNFYSASTYYILGIPSISSRRSSPSAASSAEPRTGLSSTRTTGSFVPAPSTSGPITRSRSCRWTNGADDTTFGSNPGLVEVVS